MYIGDKVTINNNFYSAFNGKAGTIVGVYTPDSDYCITHSIFVYKVRFDEPVIIDEYPHFIKDFEFMEKYLIHD